MAVPDGMEMPPVGNDVDDLDVEPPPSPKPRQLRRSRKERKGYSKATFMQDTAGQRWKLHPAETILVNDDGGIVIKYDIYIYLIYTNLYTHANDINNRTDYVNEVRATGPRTSQNC